MGVDDETGRKSDVALKAKSALELVREQSTIRDLAQRCQVHPKQIYTWKEQLLEHAGRAFGPSVMTRGFVRTAVTID
jgi:transposase-like protein